MAFGGADGKVVIDTSLNNKGFIQGVNGLKNNLGGLTSAAKKLVGVLAVAFSARALVSFGRECVELGSSIAEVQNVVDVAFGDMSYKIEEFARNSVKSYGMSRLAAKKTASTYMAMAKGMGMNEAAASDMAISLTALSGDIASFFNISQELADVKLKSVFTGETETLKDLGVVMTQTNLKAFALKKGLDANLESMSQSQLVALRYQFVMEQLSLAHGDFARTSESWANQTRVLSEQWKELKSILGQVLISVLRPLVVGLNQVVAGMIDTANTINAVTTSLFGGTSTQLQKTKQDAEGVGTAIQGNVESQEDLTAAVEDTNKAQKKSLASFDELNKLTNQTTATPSASGDLTGGGAGLGGLTETTGKTVEGLSQRMQAMLNDLKDGFRQLKEWVSDFFQPFGESWDTQGSAVLESLQKAAVSAVGSIHDIGDAFMSVWSDGTGTAFLSSILSIVTDIQNQAAVMGDRFREAWAANGNGEAIWRGILSIIQTVVSFVGRLTSATLTWVGSLDLEPITGAFKRLLEHIDPVVQVITDGLALAYTNILLPLSKWTIEEAAPRVLDLLSAACEALTVVLEALEPFATWFWQEFLLPLGQWTGETVLKALEWLTARLNDFAAWARENPEKIRTIASVILGFLGGIALYYTEKKIVDIIGSIRAAFVSFASGLSMAQVQAGLAAGTFGALALLIIQLVSCWDQLSGVQKVVAVLAAVTAAAFAAALAVGAFQSALTMGIAIAAIVAGIVTLTAVINRAQAQAQQSSKSQQYAAFSRNMSALGGTGAGRSGAPMTYSNVPRLAKGAVIPANREFLAVLGDQKSGTNIESPVSEIEAAVARGINAAGGQQSNQTERPIYLQVDGKTFARLMNPYLTREGKRVGTKLVKGVT